MNNTQIYLKSLSLKPDIEIENFFPFNLPFIRNLPEITFSSPVAIFVGENGSGKSTLLEAIAAGMGTPAVGSDQLERDKTLAHARHLAKRLKFATSVRPLTSLFLRAEDFFGFTKKLTQEMAEFDEMADEFERDLSGYGKQLAVGAVEGQKSALARKYGANPDARSHGENFLNLFQQRIVPNGLYLLDEPEAPLSPIRQLALLSIVKNMVAQKSQFIIATHSPILMAFPDAQIFSFDDVPLRRVEYESLEHVTLTRSFLNDPQAFLRRL